MFYEFLRLHCPDFQPELTVFVLFVRVRDLKVNNLQLHRRVRRHPAPRCWRGPRPGLQHGPFSPSCQAEVEAQCTGSDERRVDPELGTGTVVVHRGARCPEDSPVA